MSRLEKAEQESANKILELLDVKSELTSRQRDLETQQRASDAQTSDLQENMNKLQVRFSYNYCKTVLYLFDLHTGNYPLFSAHRNC